VLTAPRLWRDRENGLNARQCPEVCQAKGKSNVALAEILSESQVMAQTSLSPPNTSFDRLEDPLQIQLHGLNSQLLPRATATGTKRLARIFHAEALNHRIVFAVRPMEIGERHAAAVLILGPFAG